MDIDVALIQYGVELVTESGTVYSLNAAIQTLTWEEQDGQIAEKASIELADCKVDGSSLRTLLKINRIIRIYANWSAGKQQIFEGAVWEWQYNHAQNKNITITAYDPMIRLQQSKDFKYFSKGLSTPALIGAICADWGISLDYKWGQQITHEKKVFSGEKISDMIIKLLDEVRQQTGIRYSASYKGGKLCISSYGANKDVYKFTGSNVISINTKLSISELVTRVKVLGKAEDDGRSSVEAVIDGKTEYGVLQEIVHKDSDKDISAAKAEAQAILDERGQPDENITVNTPDLPFLRKGDAVEIAAGNLNGTFFVLGVSHSAASKQMTMTLQRQPAVAAAKTQSSGQGNDQESNKFVLGDTIILNGAVYIDSYGNGKGRTFTDYKSTITIAAPLSRACPYHIGQIGWVYPNEITKA